MNPLKKSKDLLKSITGGTPLDIPSVVSDLLKSAEIVREKEYDVVSVFKKIDGNDKEINNILNEILSSDVSIFDDRRGRYEEYRSVTKKYPVLKKMLKVYVANILAPDDISNESYSFDIKKSYNVINEEKINSLISEYNNFFYHLKFDEELSPIIYKSLMYGDFFVEIVNNRSEFVQTAMDYGTVLNEDILSDFLNDGYMYESDSLKIKVEDSITKQFQDINENDVFTHIVKDKKVSTVDGLSLEYHDPWEVIILEYKNVRYGYLHILTSDPSSQTNWGDQSAISQDGPSFKLANKIAEELEKRIGVIAKKDSFSIKFQKLISKLINNASMNTIIRYIPCSNIQHFKVDYTGCFAPYGEGELDDLLFRAKLLLSEDISNTVYLLSKAGGRTKIGVKAPTLPQAMNKIQAVKNAFTKKKVTIDSLGTIDTIPTTISTFENIYVPIINGEEQITIDNVDIGGPMSDRRDNSMYNLKQLLTGGSVPPPHLGYEEWVNAKATLTAENVVMGRLTVEFQNLFSKHITSLFHKIYYAIYGDSKEFNSEYKGIAFKFSKPKAIALEMENNNYTQLQNIVNILSELGISKKLIVEKYYPDLLTLIEKAENEIAKAKEPEDDAAGDVSGMDFSNVGGTDDVSVPETGDI